MRVVGERDRHVDVAVGPEVVAEHRAEEGELGDLPLPAELLDPVPVDRDPGSRHLLRSAHSRISAMAGYSLLA